MAENHFEQLARGRQLAAANAEERSRQEGAAQLHAESLLASEAENPMGLQPTQYFGPSDVSLLNEFVEWKQDSGEPLYLRKTRRTRLLRFESHELLYQGTGTRIGRLAVRRTQDQYAVSCDVYICDDALLRFSRSSKAFPKQAGIEGVGSAPSPQLLQQYHRIRLQPESVYVQPGIWEYIPGEYNEDSSSSSGGGSTLGFYKWVPMSLRQTLEHQA